MEPKPKSFIFAKTLIPSVCSVKVQMKVFLIFIILILTKLSQVQNGQTIRFKSMMCTSDTADILIHQCKVKVTSRTASFLILDLSLVKPVVGPIYVMIIKKFRTKIKMFNFWQVSLYASYRYGTIWREVFKQELIDWCDFMEGKSTNMLIQKTVFAIKDSVPQLIHKCPYEGKLNLAIEINTKLPIPIFPTGMYKFTFNFYSGSESNKVFTLWNTQEIKSEIRTSF